MKRDMDLIRKIAFAIEATEDPIESVSIAIDDFTPKQIAYHCELMNDSGLFVSETFTHTESKFEEFLILRLTSKGHDFIDSARNETIWVKAKNTISSKVGGITIDALIQYLSSQALSVLGSSPDITL